jgi:hypothetical protein
MVGGFAAGRHRAIPAKGTAASGATLDCVSCGRPVTTSFVVQVGRLYCSPVCAGSADAAVPGLYLG